MMSTRKGIFAFVNHQVGVVQAERFERGLHWFFAHVHTYGQVAGIFSIGNLPAHVDQGHARVVQVIGRSHFAGIEGISDQGCIDPYLLPFQSSSSRYHWPRCRGQQIRELSAHAE